MEGNCLDELRGNFGSEKWFINAENREKTKTKEQSELEQGFKKNRIWCPEF